MAMEGAGVLRESLVTCSMSVYCAGVWRAVRRCADGRSIAVPWPPNGPHLCGLRGAIRPGTHGSVQAVASLLHMSML